MARTKPVPSDGTQTYTLGGIVSISKSLQVNDIPLKQAPDNTPEGFFDHQKDWYSLIVGFLTSKRMCDHRDVKHKYYNVTSWSNNILCQTPTVTCKVAPLRDVASNLDLSRDVKLFSFLVGLWVNLTKQKHHSIIINWSK